MSRPPVALVGAGPGDPELLTLRAEGLLGLAGVVVADVGVAALARAFAPGAQVVAVPDGRPAVGALVAAVGGGLGAVVRLYRGDPWLHPASGPEREALEQRGVAFEAVAGVMTEVAVPALTGIAVHVRRLAVACTLGPVEALPAATDPARTLVAVGEDGAAMLRGVAAGGDGGLPAAVVPLADPAAAWRGALGHAGQAGHAGHAGQAGHAGHAGQAGQAGHAAVTAAGPAVLVVGAVCGLAPGRSAAPRPEQARAT